MNFFNRIEKLQRMDAMIRHKATGSPSSFARKLRISERTLYNGATFVNYNDEISVESGGVLDISEGEIIENIIQ